MKRRRKVDYKKEIFGSAKMYRDYYKYRHGNQVLRPLRNTNSGANDDFTASVRPTESEASHNQEPEPVPDADEGGTKKVADDTSSKKKKPREGPEVVDDMGGPTDFIFDD